MEVVPFRPSEAAYRLRVSLLKEAQPAEPWSVEGEMAADAAAAGVPWYACFALGPPRGDPIGFARARAEGGSLAGRSRLWVVVARAARRQGAGTALLHAVGKEAAAGGATEFHASTSLAEPDGLAFAVARGFVEAETEYELRLDLAAFEPRGAPPGITSLAALQRSDADWFEHYYRLHTSVQAGVPWGLGYALPDPEAFRRHHVDAEEALHDGTTIALADGEWVGLCEVWRSGGDAVIAYEELTGVLPAHRGRGLGSALVAAAASWAKGRGYRCLLTSTGARNEAMQRTARRLGFVTMGRWSHLLGPVT